MGAGRPFSQRGPFWIRVNLVGGRLVLTGLDVKFVALVPRFLSWRVPLVDVAAVEAACGVSEFVIERPTFSTQR